MPYIYSMTLRKTENLDYLKISSKTLDSKIGKNKMNYLDKAYYIGYMVKEMLSVYLKQKTATDRDSYKFKRVELPGTLLYDLFKEYYRLQQQNIYQKIDKEFYYTSKNNKDFLSLGKIKKVFSLN